MFAIDIETCRSCGGKLRVIASIEDPPVIERILEHLGHDADLTGESFVHWLQDALNEGI